jgi:hypothetical protein
VLFMAWTGGFSTKSDFARHHADPVAIAATEGWITTRLRDRVYGRKWHITVAGLTRLQEILNEAPDLCDVPLR